MSFTFEKNIVYWTEGELLHGSWEKIKVEMRKNCYWNPESREIRFPGGTLAQWQALGRDQGSIIADPGFVDAAKRDFRMVPDSPVLKLGFRPFDPDRAGVYGDSDWVEKARQ